MQLVRPSIREDVDFLAQNLRMEDVEECVAIGQTPFDALLMGYQKSTVCITLIDPKSGLPGAMAGVAPSPIDPKMGIIWLLGTPAIEQNTVKFLRGSKQVMADILSKTDHLAFYNYTHVNNTVHHRWLKWLGFVFIRKVAFGNSQFYEVVKIRS